MNKFMRSCLKLTFLLFLANFSFAQNIPKHTPMTFLGIDFTQVKLVGYNEDDWGLKIDPKKAVNEYFPRLNKVLTRDMGEVKHFFQSRNCRIDLQTISQRNALIRTSGLIQGSPNNISKEEIENIVQSYKFENLQTPYGVFLFAIELNKITEKGKYYVVLYAKEDNKYYVSELYSGRGKGFGFVNYWKDSFWEVLDNVYNKKKGTWFDPKHQYPKSPKPNRGPRIPQPKG